MEREEKRKGREEKIKKERWRGKNRRRKRGKKEINERKWRSEKGQEGRKNKI